MFERIKELIKKEFIQVFRDKRMLFIIFIAPILELLLFGYAITTDIDNISAAIIDRDRTASSREFVSKFENSGYFNLIHIPSEREGSLLLDRGEADVFMQVNPGFEQAIKTGKQAEVQFILDGTNSNTAAIISNYTSQIIADYTKPIILERMNYKQLLEGISPTENIEPLFNEARVWYNPTLESRISNVPAVAAFIIFIATIMLTSMSIVKERETGTIEQLNVTPIRTVELIVGKTIPFAMIGFIEALLVVSIVYSWFGAPLRGSLIVLFFCLVLFLFAILGIGLFISTISKTQQQAMMSTFFFSLPAVLLSGFMFPIENMPRIIQWFTYIIPTRYFIEIVIGIFLKGNGFGVLWPQMLALGMIGIAIMLISTKRFRKTID